MRVVIPDLLCNFIGFHLCILQHFLCLTDFGSIDGIRQSTGNRYGYGGFSAAL